MDKIMQSLLSTRWGRSFIGYAFAALLAILASLGYSYRELFQDYKKAEVLWAERLNQSDAQTRKCWEDRIFDLKSLHHKQDSINMKKRR